MDSEKDRETHGKPWATRRLKLAKLVSLFGIIAILLMWLNAGCTFGRWSYVADPMSVNHPDMDVHFFFRQYEYSISSTLDRGDTAFVLVVAYRRFDSMAVKAGTLKCENIELDLGDGLSLELIKNGESTECSGVRWCNLEFGPFGDKAHIPDTVFISLDLVFREESGHLTERIPVKLKGIRRQTRRSYFLEFIKGV